MKKIIVISLIMYLLLMAACGDGGTENFSEVSVTENPDEISVIDKQISKLEAATTYDEIIDCYVFRHGYGESVDEYKKMLKDKTFDYLFSDTRLNGTYYYNEHFRYGTSMSLAYGEYSEDTIVIYVMNKDNVFIVPADIVNGDSSSIPNMANADNYKYKAVDVGVCGGYEDIEEGMSIDFARCIDNYELNVEYYENAGYVTIFEVLPYQLDAEGKGTVSLNRNYYFDLAASETASQKDYDEVMEKYQEQEAQKNKEPKIGMTKREVEKSTWGKPDKKNIDEYQWGTSEQWVYDGRGYIYFEDGVVTSIQHR